MDTSSKYTHMNLTREQEKLALEIAHALDDMESIQWHRKMVARYSEEYLRSKLNKVLAMPESKIQKSRGALYNSLLR